MHVCFCADVTEDEVREAIREGNTTVEQLQDEIDVANNCCSCLGYVRKLLIDELT